MNVHKQQSLRELHEQLCNAGDCLREQLDLVRSLNGACGSPLNDTDLTDLIANAAHTPPAGCTTSAPKPHPDGHRQGDRTEHSSEPSHARSTPADNDGASNPSLTPAVELLTAIDNAIELHQRISQLASEIPQVIFNSWFVDFEPVRTKIAAAARWRAMQPDNESASPVCYMGELDPQYGMPDLITYCDLAAMETLSGKSRRQLVQLEKQEPHRYAQLQATAALFPSAMQASELGKIPGGWSIGKLSDILDFANQPGKTTQGPLNDGSPANEPESPEKPPHPYFSITSTAPDTCFNRYIKKWAALGADEETDNITCVIYPPRIIAAFENSASDYLNIAGQFNRRASTLYRLRDTACPQHPHAVASRNAGTLSKNS